MRIRPRLLKGAKALDRRMPLFRVHASKNPCDQIHVNARRTLSGRAALENAVSRITARPTLATQEFKR
jgi:hypothetical protein